MLPKDWHNDSTLAIALASEHKGTVRGYVITVKKIGKFYRVQATTGKIEKLNPSSREAYISNGLSQVEAMRRVASLVHRKIHKQTRKYVIAARHENAGASSLSNMLDSMLALEPCLVPYYKLVEAVVDEIQQIDVPEFDIE